MATSLQSFYHKRPSITFRSILTILVALNLLPKTSCFGYVSPEKVYQLVNGSTDVTCTIDPMKYDGKNSSYLSFEQGKKKIPKEQITILNSTTINWHIDRVTESDSKRYECLLEEKIGVGVVDFYIGYLPRNVTDFECRSENWHNMTCTFTKPWNPIPTIYALKYRINGSQNYEYNCTLNPLDDAKLVSAIPHENYRQVHELFRFTLNIKNELGNLIQEIDVNNFEAIVPAPPENISFSHVTSSSVTIHWKISYKLEVLYKSRKISFIHDVRILSEFENTNDNNTKWQEIDSSRVRKMDTNNQTLIYYLELHDLKYANSWYDVRIRVRTNRAKNPNEMYSDVSALGFRTEPRRPDRPPNIDEGAFFINDDNDVYIYWEELHKSERNGPNASYIISEVRKDGSVIGLAPAEITHTMAKFSKIDLHSTYEFTLRSRNSLGTSDRGSTIRIPAARLDHPRNIKKLSQDDMYNLSWLPPARNTTDISYTVFWCKPKNSLPNVCESEFKFTRVPYNNRSFNLTTDSSINFAVSTNSATSNSGMVWAMCTAAHDIGKIKSNWITRIGSTSMGIQWELDCMYNSIVKGYVIKYCPIKDPKTLECKEALRNITIPGPANTYTITQLKPYTTYKIVLVMFSSTRHGPDSDPLHNTTLEDVPSPPLEFKVYDVQNTSMKLEWKKPRDINGVLMYYKIFFNASSVKVDNVANETTKEPFEKITYLLTNLTSYTDYALLVIACNRHCSNSSNTEHRKTGIGIPGPVNQPTSKILNDKQVQIVWSEPQIRSGHIDYYELKTLYKDNSGTIVQETRVKIGGKHTTCIRTPPCTSISNSNNIEYYVRPVNVIRSPHEKFPETSTTLVAQKYSDTTFTNSIVDLDSTTKDPIRHHHQSCESNDTKLLRWLELDPYSEHLPGEWSKPGTTNCVGSIDAKALVTIICCITLVTTVIIASYRIYQRLKDMKNIVIVLPAGLEDITKEIKPENLEKNRIPKSENILDTLGIFDEEDRLLRRRAESDSSGRSQSDESHSQRDSHEDGYDAEKLVDGDSDSNNSMPTDHFSSSPRTVEQINLSQPLTNPILTSTPQQPHPPVMSNGYVNPNMMIRPNASGYVQHTAMSSATRPPTNTTGGYVPVNQFGRPIMNAIPPENTTDLNNVKISMKTPIVAQTDSNGISGYVTHKQLSDFGHRMQ